MNRQLVRVNRPPVSMRDCLEVLKKHVHLVFVSSLVLAVLGIVGVSLLPDVYRASTTILVDPQKIPERYVASTITTDPNARLNTLTQQVLSDSRLQQIIENGNLYPEMRRKRSREEVLDYMRERTRIELKQTPQPDQGLSSFSIAYEDEDRLLVANVANDLAASFIEWNLRVRQQQALATTEFLSDELQQAKLSLEEQERELEAFKMKHAGATPDELNGNLQALSRLQAEAQSNMDAISRLDQERILLTDVKPTELRDTASLTERGRLLQERRRLESELWNLKRQFTDTYPDVVAVTRALMSLNAQLATMPEPQGYSTDETDANSQVRVALIDKELQRHKQQQADLEQEIQYYQARVDSVPVLETQLAKLTRNYETSRQNYQSLLDKTYSAGMAEELERTQQGRRFTVLDSAKTPGKPISPNRLLLIAGVLVLAFLLPASLTIGLYLMKGSVRSESELKEMLPLNIPFLAAVPPIVSQADLRRERMLTVQTVTLSICLCTALIIFLFKVRPTL